MKTRPLLLSLAVLAPACGSSAPALRPLDQGVEVDRFAALQDNLASIIERAKTPADASKSLDAYCGEHRADIDAILAGVQRVTAEEGAPEREKVIESTNRLMSRLDKVGEGWAADTSVEQAMRGCLGGPAAPDAPPEGAVGPIEPVGIAACDLVIDRYQQCIATLPEAARAPALDGLAQMRAMWATAIAGGPEAAGQIEGACAETAATMAESMAALCPDVTWK